MKTSDHNTTARARAHRKTLLARTICTHAFALLIGGVALQRWGETRMTTDADATVLTHWVNDESVADLLLSTDRSLLAQPMWRSVGRLGWRGALTDEGNNAGYSQTHRRIKNP